MKSYLPLLLLTMCVTWAVPARIDAQSSRPRRVSPPDTLLGPEPKSPPGTDKNALLLDVSPSKPVGSAPVSSNTTHAYQLFQQKQYEAAAAEARQIAAADPTNAEAWKLAGFSEFYLKQYAEASDDLQKALDLQRTAKQEDSHTVDALAESSVLAERFAQALPLLVNVTTRSVYIPDARIFNNSGMADIKTGTVSD